MQAQSNNLFVRQPNGRYRAAEPAEVVRHAVALIDVSDRGQAINCTKRAVESLRVRLGTEKSEQFVVMWLDTRHRIIAVDTLFYGTIDAASVYPREVVRAAIEHNAAACILAHNHPSGIAEPSSADQNLTRRLRDALALIDVRTLDHVIIAGMDYCAFSEKGLI